jgi:hypothetical protein
MLKEPVELHCIGGFVLVYFYGFPRTTADIDYFPAVPANLNLEEVAGQAQLFRLQEMAPGKFKHLRLLIPDPYDCILSKLERGSGKDRDDADFLFRSQKLDAHLLRERYEKERGSCATT